MKHTFFVLTIAASVLFACTPSSSRAQGYGDPAPVLAAQREALAKLAYMDGVWRGTGWTILPNGERHTFTQTERVGPFLDGAIKVVEGRGYGDDGSLMFNAFGVISYDVEAQAYAMRAHAQGRKGDFVLTPTGNGFVWEIPAGPMTIRYTAVIEDGTWTEYGERILPGQDPIRFHEMTLTRVGDTDWPAAGAIPPR